ncbi:unnamed protein product [Prunus armeniaca]|uniref:Uncharacterized protein n=1 Tax=Prunus armeniaca TaxID=36596 RepID=A0A6J5WWM6_PRUAR|nr:unnamed protein product [Prunus armeniaca]
MGCTVEPLTGMSVRVILIFSSTCMEDSCLHLEFSALGPIKANGIPGVQGRNLGLNDGPGVMDLGYFEIAPRPLLGLAVSISSVVEIIQFRSIGMLALTTRLDQTSHFGLIDKIAPTGQLSPRDRVDPTPRSSQQSNPNSLRSLAKSPIRKLGSWP